MYRQTTLSPNTLSTYTTCFDNESQSFQQWENSIMITFSLIWLVFTLYCQHHYHCHHHHNLLQLHCFCAAMMMSTIHSNYLSVYLSPGRSIHICNSQLCYSIVAQVRVMHAFLVKWTQQMCTHLVILAWLLLRWWCHYCHHLSQPLHYKQKRENIPMSLSYKVSSLLVSV